jgi:hypothetical protein
MSKPKFKHWLSTTTLIGLGALAASPASAATSDGGSAKARYQRQVAQCETIRDHDTRANCLSEASTAYAQTQPTPPQENPMQLASNALRRCDRLPEVERNDCVARVNGAGTADGSVAGGGILYTLVTRETSPVAQASPAAPASSTTAPSSVVPDPLPAPAAGPTPGARPSPTQIEPAPADVPPSPPVPPQPPRSPGSPS